MSLYDHYGAYKNYSTPIVGQKHMQRLDREVWGPMDCQKDMSFLEIGCGTGLVLMYLYNKGLQNVIGIDQDPALSEFIPIDAQPFFKCANIWDFLKTDISINTFDRILMFDVMEHFTAEEGVSLLQALAPLLKPGGQVLLKTPNASSPWGLQFQYGDLTHKTAYTPDSMRQLAAASGFQCTHVYPHYLGSPSRQRKDRIFHWFASKILMTSPEIWTANFFTNLRPIPN